MNPFPCNKATTTGSSSKWSTGTPVLEIIFLLEGSTESIIEKKTFPENLSLFDASNSFVWLLEEALPDVSHDFLVLSDLGWDADKGAELRRQIDVLTLLADLKQGLVD